MKIVIKGAGEMASGIAGRLHGAGLMQICMTEIEKPLAVRRSVAFCSAVYQGVMEIEGITGRLVHDRAGIYDTWRKKEIAVIVDPAWSVVAALKPDIVVDAIMAKKNLGTCRNEASVVIAVGPGFKAPDEAHAVIESNRGHNLGRVLYTGSAEPNTGIPGVTAGFSRERVLRSPHEGRIRYAGKRIGDKVLKGDTVLCVDDTPVKASIDGIIRGLIGEIPVGAGEKIGDIEPRENGSFCSTISDKARAIGGGVLEAIMHFTSGDLAPISRNL